MKRSDAPAISRLASDIHPDFPESDAVLFEKLELFPSGCFSLVHDGMIAGYILSHPWKRKHIPPLDELLCRLPVDSDVYYIHDLALSALSRGCGMAQEMVKQIMMLARSQHFERISLVALGDAAPFWQGQQFVPVDVPEISSKLEAYGTGARYMEHMLQP